MYTRRLSTIEACRTLKIGTADVNTETSASLRKSRRKAGVSEFRSPLDTLIINSYRKRRNFRIGSPVRQVCRYRRSEQALIKDKLRLSTLQGQREFNNRCRVIVRSVSPILLCIWNCSAYTHILQEYE